MTALSRLRRLDFTNIRTWSDVASIALLVMDFLWAVLFYQMLTETQAGWPRIVITFGILLFGSQLFMRILISARFSLWIRRALYGLWTAAMIFLSYRLLFYYMEPFTLAGFFTRPVQAFTQQSDTMHEFWHLVFAAAAIWRGSLFFGDLIDSDSAVGSFQLGLLMFIIYGIFGWNFPALAGLNVFLFIFFALLAMSTSRIASAGERKGGKLPRVDSFWAKWILLISTGLVLLSTLVSYLITTPLAETITRIYVFIASILVSLLVLITRPFFMLLEWLAPSLSALIAKMFEGLNLDNVVDILESMSNLDTGEASDPTWIIQFSRTIRPYMAVAIAVIVIGLIVFGVRLYQNRRKASEEAETSGNIAKNLPSPENPSIFNRIRWTPAKLFTAVQIRKIYHQLIQLATRLGSPRPASATPLEYMKTLVYLFSDHRAEVRVITNAYNLIRYGEVPESAAEVEKINQAWKSIQEEGKLLLARKRHGV